MKAIILISMIIFGSYQMFPQAEQKGKKVYKIWVKLNNGETIKGYLSQRKDSSITVIYDEGNKSEDFNIVVIERLKFRRKGRVGRGIGLGAAGGFLAGAVAGYSAGDDYWFGTKEEGALAAGIVFAPLGAIAGGLVSAIKKTYIISGDQNNYEMIKNELLKYEK